jgi:hypothetical protein
MLDATVREPSTKGTRLYLTARIRSGLVSWYSRITAWDYLYFVISLVIILVGLVLFVTGTLVNQSIVSQLGSVLVGTGIVSAFVDKLLHKQLENLLNRRLDEHLMDFTLRDVLKGGGVTNMIPSRQDYHGRSIEEFVRTAEHNLVMTGIAFRTAIQYERLQDTLGELAQRGVKVTISLINPDNALAVNALAMSLGEQPQDLSREIREAIAALSITRNGLTDANRANFSLKVHDAVPFASGIMIDAFEPSRKGTIQVEVKPYKARRSDCFAIETKGSNDYIDNKTLYKTLRDSWTKLIVDGHPVP